MYIARRCQLSDEVNMLVLPTWVRDACGREFSPIVFHRFRVARKA
jgi:hypothetical protein